MEAAKVEKSRKKTGGRKAGVPNRKNAETIKKIEESGMTPLEFMLNVMRGTSLPEDASASQVVAMTTLRFEAAKAAAPYVHAKLASVEHSGKGGGPIQMTFTSTDAEL